MFFKYNLLREPLAAFRTLKFAPIRGRSIIRNNIRVQIAGNVKLLGRIRFLVVFKIRNVAIIRQILVLRIAIFIDSSPV